MDETTPIAPAAGTPGANPIAEKIDPGPVDLNSTIDRVTDQFVLGENITRETAPAGKSESKSKGKSGWPKGKPRKISVASVDSTPLSAPGLAPGALPGAAPLVPAPVPQLDLAAIEAMVEGVIGLMDEFAVAMIERAAMTKTEDAAFSTAAGKKAVMSDKTRALLKVGGMGCVRKYALTYQYIEETALGIGFGVWAIGLSQQVKAIRKLPERPPAARNGE